LFEEEVKASKERVQACRNEAQSLIDSNHYASDDVRKEMEKAEEMWEKLQKQCLERGIVLFVTSVLFCFLYRNLYVYLDAYLGPSAKILIEVATANSYNSAVSI